MRWQAAAAIDPVLTVRSRCLSTLPLFGYKWRVARLFVDEFTSEFKAGAPSLRSLQGRGFWLCPVSPLEVGGGPLV
jgi:hypothetical protein